MRKLFNEEELECIRQSPYIKSVTPKEITYGPVFELKYHELIKFGYTMRDSFDQLGLDPDILGHQRMKAYHRRYKKRLDNNQINIPMKDGKEISVDQHMEDISYENKVLKQENEFLKKKMQLTHQYKKENNLNNTTSD